MGTDERDLARRWMDAASEDLAAAELMLSADPPLLLPSLFHSEQAGEKALKAVLVSGGTLFPRIHDLVALWTLAAKTAGWTEPPSGLERLTSYAVAPRYPDPDREYTPEEARQAIEDAREIVALCSEALDDR